MNLIDLRILLSAHKVIVKVFATKICVVIIAVLFIISCDNTIKKQNTSTDRTSLLDSLQLTDMNGQLLNMQQFKGKVLFINFWATWCKPCILEMPSIANAQKRLHDEVIFILASAENREETEGFRSQSRYPFIYTRIENMESLAVQALPTTFIFSSKGKLVFSESGARKWDDSSNMKLIQQIINNE